MTKKRKAAVEDLQEFIHQRNGNTNEYTIEYYPRSQPMSTGYVYRGYYLIDRTPSYWGRPRTEKSPDWEAYVNGNYIGHSYEAAYQYILENIPDREVKRTQEDVNREKAEIEDGLEEERCWKRSQRDDF